MDRIWLKVESTRVPFNSIQIQHQMSQTWANQNSIQPDEHPYMESIWVKKNILQKNKIKWRKRFSAKRTGDIRLPIFGLHKMQPWIKNKSMVNIEIPNLTSSEPNKHQQLLPSLLPPPALLSVILLPSCRLTSLINK